MASVDNKIRQIREHFGFSQKQLAKCLCVSSALVSAIEVGTNHPSDILLELIVYKLGINKDWLLNNRGEMFLEQTEQQSLEPTVASKAMLTAAVLGPVLPQISVGIIATVGVSHVVKRMCRAYGAKNATVLAQDHLGISKSAIAQWGRKGKIPDRYYSKTTQETGVPLEYLISDDLNLQMNKKVLFDFIAKVENNSKFQQMSYEQKSAVLEEYLKNLNNRL